MVSCERSSGLNICASIVLRQEATKSFRSQHLLNAIKFTTGSYTIIVIGHVIAVVLAHIEGLRVFGRRRDTLVSQIPMVVLMVAYTTLSLWILAQPIVG